MAIHWTNKELKALRAGFRGGKSDEEIGEELERTTAGVTYKRNDMGLHRRASPKRRRKRRAAKGDRGPDRPYSIVIRGPNRELSMQVDRDTGQAVFQLMLGVT